MNGNVYPAHTPLERRLEGAPRVFAVNPEYTEAAELALAHARVHLRLPASLPVLWVSCLGGSAGECWSFPDGTVELRINHGADLSPYEIARVILHECKHASDGQHHGLGYWAAEDAADAFAAYVMDPRETTRDFLRLSQRRPSGRLR